MCHQKHHKWYEECPCPGCSIIRAFNPQRMGVFTSTQKSQCSLRKHKHKWGFPGGTSSKESACHTEDIRDMSLIPGSGRSPGWRHGNPLQYSCLENPMDKGAWRAIVHKVTKSDMTKGLSKHIPWVCSMCIWKEKGINVLDNTTISQKGKAGAMWKVYPV